MFIEIIIFNSLKNQNSKMQLVEAHVKVSQGKALKKKVSTPFNELLHEYSNSGSYPFLSNKKFDVIYFSSENHQNEKLELQSSETERFIKTHTHFKEKISKPQNQWVLFAQLNGRTMGTVFNMKDGKQATANIVSPILKDIWAGLDKQAMQYYLYLSALEHNLHEVIHPNYQVQHIKVATSNISSDLLASNLIINNRKSSNIRSNNNFVNTLKKTKKGYYKLSIYSFPSLINSSKAATKKKVEKYVMSQRNKYAGLKTLKYCNKIKFNTSKNTNKRNKVTKVSKNFHHNS